MMTNSTVNSMTIHQLIVKRKMLNKVKFNKQVQLAKVLFSINFVFIIFNLPYTIYITNQYLLGVNFFVTFGYRVVVVLQKIDYSCNFIVYIISNKLFREQVRSIFCSKNRVEPIQDIQIQVPQPVNNNAEREVIM